MAMRNKGGRPPKPMPEWKPRPDGEEITAENLAQALLRLPPDYEWQYLKDLGGIENGEERIVPTT